MTEALSEAPALAIGLRNAGTGAAYIADVEFKRLDDDGKAVHEGVTEKAQSPTSIPPSLVLGAELLYFHSSYYRGLMGRTLVFDRAVSSEQLVD